MKYPFGGGGVVGTGTKGVTVVTPGVVTVGKVTVTGGVLTVTGPPIGVLLTLTVNEHEAVRLTASVAVQVTVVTPSGKVDPAAGVQDEVTPAQLSETVGAG